MSSEAKEKDDVTCFLEAKAKGRFALLAYNLRNMLLEPAAVYTMFLVLFTTICSGGVMSFDAFCKTGISIGIAAFCYACKLIYGYGYALPISENDDNDYKLKQFHKCVCYGQIGFCVFALIYMLWWWVAGTLLPLS